MRDRRQNFFTLLEEKFLKTTRKCATLGARTHAARMLLRVLNQLVLHLLAKKHKNKIAGYWVRCPWPVEVRTWLPALEWHLPHESEHLQQARRQGRVKWAIAQSPQISRALESQLSTIAHKAHRCLRDCRVLLHQCQSLRQSLWPSSIKQSCVYPNNVAQLHSALSATIWRFE